MPLIDAANGGVEMINQVGGRFKIVERRNSAAANSSGYIAIRLS
jgi:hypothetical protein